jgi:hypothetical protein
MTAKWRHDLDRLMRHEGLLLWVGLLGSSVAALYAGTSFFFYAWMGTVAPDRWPPDRVATWAGASAILCIVCLTAGAYCAVRLVQRANSRTKSDN